MCSELTFELKARPSELFDYAQQLVAALPVELRTDLVEIGLVEGLSNAIIHGALQISSAQRDQGELEAYVAELDEMERLRGENVIEVRVVVDPGWVSVAITDPGPGFDWHGVPIRDRRGLRILREAFDRCEWNDSGNCLQLTLLRPGKETP